MDTVCLWVGRVVVFGGIFWAAAAVAYASFVGFAVASSYRRKP